MPIVVCDMVSRLPRTVLFLHSSSGLYGSDRQLLRLAEGLDSLRFKPLVVLSGKSELAAVLQETGIETICAPLATLRRSLASGRGSGRDGGPARPQPAGAGPYRRRACGGDRPHEHVDRHRRPGRGRGDPDPARRPRPGDLPRARWTSGRKASGHSCVGASCGRTRSRASRRRLRRSSTGWTVRSCSTTGSCRSCRHRAKLHGRRSSLTPIDSLSPCSAGSATGRGRRCSSVRSPRLRSRRSERSAWWSAHPLRVRSGTSGRSSPCVSSLGLGHRLRLLGFRRDIETILGAADAVAVPSTSPDPLPNAALEAASAGVAVGGVRRGRPARDRRRREDRPPGTTGGRGYPCHDSAPACDRRPDEDPAGRGRSGRRW